MKEFYELVNMFFYGGNKFIPELHLRYLNFAYSAYGRFTEHTERIKKFKEIDDIFMVYLYIRYIYKNGLEKACFAHDAVYADSK